MVLTPLSPTRLPSVRVVSVRPDLVGEALAADLGQLRDRLPPLAAATARDIVAAELGRPLDDIYASFDDTPVAAASVAQVHFAETADGQPVAVKVLRPGVADAFASDLELFAWLADAAERQVAGLKSEAHTSELPSLMRTSYAV